ncbi:flavodoxin family protein [Litoribrevibacter euphylliae]|uniref:Flavodoxin family protein n=1 Tax=Litoribrevibacter euphylliae TaxID=1834034 RepID=A0ABV7HJF3_9GAMM
MMHTNVENTNVQKANHPTTTLIIFSSARDDGNTAQLAKDVQQLCDGAKLVYLDQLNITPYNYQNEYPMDDFYLLVEEILAAENIVFASPVYWAGVTANIKALIDRITELCDVPELKHKGRALKGKRGFYLATSVKNEVSPAFHEFFRHVYTYFDMELVGQLHLNCSEGYEGAKHRNEVNSFVELLALESPSEAMV